MRLLDHPLPLILLVLFVLAVVLVVRVIVRAVARGRRRDQQLERIEAKLNQEDRAQP